MKIMEILPTWKDSEKLYVFPRSICNFLRFRVLSFIKRARFLARGRAGRKTGSLQHGGTWRNMAGYI